MKVSLWLRLMQIWEIFSNTWPGLKLYFCRLDTTWPGLKLYFYRLDTLKLFLLGPVSVLRK